MKDYPSSEEGRSIEKQRIAAALSMSEPGQNAHAALNSIMQQQQILEKARIYYDERGQTLPTRAVALAMDAVRNINHSRILARNINANTGQPRPQYVAAHHIVARLAWHARLARACLFGWSISIDDADNGVYLPRYAHSVVPTLPNANIHQNLHTRLYYMAVNARLDSIKHMPTNFGRQELRAIAKELVAGIFPH